MTKHVKTRSYALMDIRSGHKVAQLTYVSPEPADLNRLQELTATAVAELGL